MGLDSGAGNWEREEGERREAKQLKIGKILID